MIHKSVVTHQKPLITFKLSTENMNVKEQNDTNPDSVPLSQN